MGVRDENREKVDAAIRAAARAQIREVGGGALSMRAVAREVGMVSSAVYRYYPTREALLTALVVESYGSLAHTLEQASGDSAQGWRDAAHALRGWALERPHEFQLIYGTPIPGYVAPPETVPLAARIAAVFLGAAAGSTAPAASGTLADQLAPLGGGTSAAPLTAVAELVGLLTLELGGHWVGTADPADHLYAFAVEQQVGRLGLS
ncbi:MAG: TetR/AcrR family transcriptional regulator [Propionibacteriaceae bacterium]|nr:TetR/AcrR family transcriptional regulator [Propionibacteriaceae bacterium]